MIPLKKELQIGILAGTAIILLVVYFVVSYPRSSVVQPSSSQNQQSVTLTIGEVNKHNTETDCWFIISNKVYDVTSYMDHPGGRQRIVFYCGQDAAQAFQTKDGQGGHSTQAQQLLQNFYIGDLNSTLQSLPTRSINSINRSDD